MKIEQIYTGCLAEAAYYIQSQGEAIIIDPLRETSPYIERAEKNDAEGNKIYKELKAEYLDKYMPKPDADPHSLSTGI